MIVKSFIGTSTKTLSEIRSIWKALPIEKRRKMIDPRFHKLVDMINEVPSLQTLWSCSGHTDAENCEWENNLVSYLTLMIRVDAREHLMKFIDRLEKHPDYTSPDYTNPDLVTGISVEYSQCWSAPIYNQTDWISALTFRINRPKKDDPTGELLAKEWEKLFSPLIEDIMSDWLIAGHMKVPTGKLCVDGYDVFSPFLTPKEIEYVMGRIKESPLASHQYIMTRQTIEANEARAQQVIDLAFSTRDE